MRRHRTPSVEFNRYRNRFCRAFASCLLLAGATFAEEEGVFKSEELNFEIRLPEDSVDWEFKEFDKEAHKTLRVWLYSPYADSDAYASVQVFAQKMPSAMVRKKLEKIADKWQSSLEGDLANPRKRKDGIDQWAGVDTYHCDVEGDVGSGIHTRRWLLLRNGEYLYTIIVDRHLGATKDEDLGAEIEAILKSFKFGEIRKLKGDRKVKEDDAPETPGGKKGDNKKTEPVGDPEKLKEAPFQMDFWRFKCVKPANVLEQALSENDTKNAIKVWWVGEVNTVRLGIRVYVWSLKNKTFTLDKLVETRKEAFKKRVKDQKEPKLDEHYAKQVQQAKKAYLLELLGRSTRRERWIYLMAECKNDRQYMVEIYSMGDTSDKVWGKAIDAFLKSFEPLKE